MVRTSNLTSSNRAIRTPCLKFEFEFENSQSSTFRKWVRVTSETNKGVHRCTSNPGVRCTTKTSERPTLVSRTPALVVQLS